MVSSRRLAGAEYEKPSFEPSGVLERPMFSYSSELRQANDDDYFKK